MKKTILILIFPLLFFACSIIVPSQKFYQEKQIKEKVLENLQIFQSFKLQGTIEITSRQFAFYKNISIKKYKDVLRIDIFAGGLFGLSPQMDAQVFVSDSILIYIPKKNLLFIDDDYTFIVKNDTINIPKHLFIDTISQYDEWLISKENIVVRHNNTKYTFNPNTFNIKEIHSSNSIITFSNYKQGFPHKIFMEKEKRISVKLNIDSVDLMHNNYPIKMFRIDKNAKRTRI
ncbi:MAG: hypothetical protein DRH57_09125 [Candidatus Cloacimonadota bacterium]|nr:MAG: hypothetical protein DRH57_09125 [Candidatus Cloacimonadota bacterium]